MKRFFLSVLSLAAPFAAAAKDIAVVAHDPGYYTSLGKHIGRWLEMHGLESSLDTPSTMSASLAKAKIAFLVGFDNPADAEMSALTSFVSRGGKLVVFYSSSPRLASLMGVRTLGYAAASYPGRWSRMDFLPGAPDGAPASILQTSTVLQRAQSIPGKSRTMAVWKDRKGASTGDAAWISSKAGYWMTHVLLADGDERLKARLLAAIAGDAAPGLWSYAKFKKERAEEIETTRRYAAAQSPKTDEIHAVWDHSGCGLYPGDWPKTIRILKANGVTDLFVNVAGAGFAHYTSDVLPRSKTYEQEGDQLAACLSAAKGSGIRVHAWILCFNATRSTASRLKDFEKKGWRLKAKDGTLTEYLDPSNAKLRKYLLSAIDELQAKYKVDGIHLDFVRWYEKSVRPPDAVQTISKFVAEAKLHVLRPARFTVAVLGKYPACIDSVGQDWVGWLGSNIVDFVVPMDYTEDFKKFDSFLAQHSALKTHAAKTIVGIGVTANESRLDAMQVMNQIRRTRKYGMAGQALFDLDTTLEKDILPYLRLGLWRR